MKPNHKNLLLRQKINTANRLLDSQTLLHLPRLDIPEPDCLVIASADQSLASEEERRTEISVSVEEAQGLREGMCEVGFAVVKGAVEGLPGGLVFSGRMWFGEGKEGHTSLQA
jgi:hypothetical protein